MDLNHKPSAETTYQSYLQVPQTFQATNQYTLSNDQTDCNPFQAPNNFGNYFKTCQTPSAFWGSNKPAPDVCGAGNRSQIGVPCHSIWNNQTRRKGVVDYSR